MSELGSFTEIFAKFALYLGFLVCAGTVFVQAVFRLKGHDQLALRFAALALVACLAGLALNVFTLTGSVSGIFDLTILGLLFSTPVGTVLKIRLAAIVGLIVFLALQPRNHWPPAILASLGLWTFTINGHIAQSGDILLRLFLFIHLILAAFWIGILRPLRVMLNDKGQLSLAANVADRFGRIALVFVPILLAMGTLMSLRLVGSFSALWGTSYGNILVIKIGLVAGILGLAAMNKTRLSPALTGKDPNAARWLSLSIKWEWRVFLLVLLVSAAMTTGPAVPTY